MIDQDARPYGAIVIGAGPGGTAAALRAVDLGLRWVGDHDVGPILRAPWCEALASRVVSEVSITQLWLGSSRME